MPRAVGLFVFTRRTDDEPLLVVLQRRGLINFEKGGEAESFPNGFQATCHGSLEPGEVPILALRRECKEELGWDDLPVQTTDLALLTPEEANARLYCTFQPFSVVTNFRLHASTGGLALFDMETFARTVRCVPFANRRTFPSIDKWGMVDDEHEAVMLGFQYFMLHRRL